MVEQGELLPCPNPWCFATQAPLIVSDIGMDHDHLGYKVMCFIDCNLSGPTAPTQAEAITAWNTRHSTAPVQPTPVLEGELLPVIQDDREAADETGWLIEEDAGGFVHWIALAEDQWPRYNLETRRSRRNADDDVIIERYKSPVRRVKDANEALRFARKEDADAAIKLFDKFLLHAKAAEHAWPAAHRLRHSTDFERGEEEAYDIGKRDGYGEAVQDLDLATGGDGEYKGSPFGTVDVPAMKARIIERCTDAASDFERGLEAGAKVAESEIMSMTDLGSYRHAIKNQVAAVIRNLIPQVKP